MDTEKTGRRRRAIGYELAVQRRGDRLQAALRDPDYDLIADFGDRLVRVQVKTSTYRLKTSTYRRNNRWEVTLATRGGNQSWNGLVRTSSRPVATTSSSMWATAGAGTYLRAR